MAIKGVLNFLIALFVLGIIGGIALAVMNSARGRKAQPGVLLAAISLIVVVVIIALNAGLVLIQPNEVGVVFRQTAQGDASLREPLGSGLHWVIPFIDQVIVYDASQQSVTMAGVTEAYNQAGEAGMYSAVRAISKDGQTINVDVTVIYKLDPTQINQIHRSWRNTYEEGFIVPQTRSEVRNLVSLYGAEEIYSGGRAQLETQVFDALKEQIQPQGFILTNFLIRDISFSDQFTQAIEQKQIAEQEAQQAQRRVEQARQEAEQVRVEAQGRADAVVIAAESDAEATIIRAEADAEALRLINEVLTQNPNLIQWQYINQLGDQVRLIIIPSNSPFLFDLQQLMQQAGAQQTYETIPTPSGGTQP